MNLEALFRSLKALESLVDGFFRRLDQSGLEGFRKFYGVYRAVVVANDDPERRGRIQAFCPDVGQSESNFPRIWIDPVFDAAGAGRGTFCPPERGDCVRVVFSAGDPGRPTAYFGGWFGQNDLPGELSYSDSGFPEKRGFVTRMGHSVVISDEPGKEKIELTWHKANPADPANNDRSLSADRSSGDTASVTLDADGITIIDKDGNEVHLNGGKLNVKLSGAFEVTGSEVNLKVGNVNLGKAAAFKAVLGEALLTYLNSHFHPTGVGPSGPPVTPATNVLLSGSVKLQK